MLPHERALVERLKNEPFALLGINSDGDAEKVKKILAQEKITWRQALEGSPSGPLPTRWNISSWPTLYVIDAKGVIRRIGHIDDGLDELLNELIAEAKRGR